MTTKDVIGFEGLYKITSTGRIYRVAYKKKVGGITKYFKRRYLPLSGTRGYPTAMLYYDYMNSRTFTIHRLMAIHFIHNPFPLIRKEVNHKNGDILDYRLKNLEWCSRSENILHAKRKNFKINKYEPYINAN